jgi:hypothetical protein
MSGEGLELLGELLAAMNDGQEGAGEFGLKQGR